MENKKIIVEIKDGENTGDKFRSRAGNKGTIGFKFDVDNKWEKREHPSFLELYIKQCLFIEHKKQLEKLQKNKW